MATNRALAPASELARNNGVRFPNESDAYRQARDALLAEEIELRRHIERVAEQRRALPPGGEVTEGYRFEGEDGPASFADLFGDKETLVAYSYMYGPERDAALPDVHVPPDLVGRRGSRHRTARRLRDGGALADRAADAFKKERGWRHLKLYSDPSGDYTRDYVSADDADVPAFNVFTRRDGTIRHFWSGEMGFATADPGQDPRGAPDLMPLWTILDATPEGRGTDWYPKLAYEDDGVRRR